VIVEEPPLPDRSELRTFRTAIAEATDSDGGTGPRLALEPASTEVQVGQTATYELVFEPATDGVRAYDLNLTVANASVAGVAEGTDAIGGEISVVDVTPEGERIRFQVVGGTGGTGTVTLGTVTLTAREPGTTRLSLSDVLVGDRNDSEYAIETVEDATLTVRETPPEPEAPDLSDDGNPARDLDGDGLHEDITGDGTPNVIDVSVFLGAFDSAAVQDNLGLFDFNDDGDVNILDVADLLGRL